MSKLRLCVENPNYCISESGDVRRVIPAKGATVDGSVLSPKIGKRGYWQVTLWDKKSGKTYDVHRLIASAFLGPPPTVDHVVAHEDGNPLNNQITNLRWATREENEADKHRHGTYFRRGKRENWRERTGVA